MVSKKKLMRYSLLLLGIFLLFLPTSALAISTPTPIDGKNGSIVFNLTAGTEDLPSLYFAGETDTGMWHPAANTLALSLEGAEKFTLYTGEAVFNEDGDDYDFRVEGDIDPNLFVVDGGVEVVRIGSTLPTLQLVDDDGNTVVALLQANATDANTGDFYIYTKQEGAWPLTFWIDSDGGLQVTDPAMLFHGDLFVFGNNTAQNLEIVFDNDDTDARIVWDDTNNVIRINDNGPAEVAFKVTDSFSAGADKFVVNSAGVITKISNVAYTSWPAAHTVGTLLDDGAGNLTFGGPYGTSGGGAPWGRVTFWSGTQALGNSDRFIWDNTNRILTLGEGAAADITLQFNDDDTDPKIYFYEPYDSLISSGSFRIGIPNDVGGTLLTITSSEPTIALVDGVNNSVAARVVGNFVDGNTGEFFVRIKQEGVTDAAALWIDGDGGIEATDPGMVFYGDKFTLGNNTNQDLQILFDTLASDELFYWNNAASTFWVTDDFRVEAELTVGNAGGNPFFRVTSGGDITLLKNVPYIWPTVQGGANTYLKNDGAGNLSWSSDPGLSVTVTTTTAAPTTLATIVTIASYSYKVKIDVISRRTDSGDESGGYYCEATLHNIGGNVVIVAQSCPVEQETNAAWAVSFTGSGNNLLIQVTGEAAKTIKWNGRYQAISAN